MSFYSFSITYLLVIILSLTCQSLSSAPVKPKQSQESFIKNTEEFIPTNEWQMVKEGQAIPPGLHVRLNLQNGLREAKLLENTNEKQSSSNDLVPVATDNKQQEELSKANLERAFAKLNFSKDDVVTDKKHEEEIKTKFRSYEELKKDFESINMKIETEQEILTKLVNKLTSIDHHANLKTTLTDLEFYLHQYDNAIIFADMNGLQLLIRLLNSSDTDNEIRYLTSLALGAAFQGNPKVQSKGLHLGFVEHLLRLLNTERDDNIKYRLLFTLATLLRNFPEAQTTFIQHGGIETILKIFDEANSNKKISVRAIELMNDLITEKDQSTDDKRHAYENIHIRDELVKHGWCLRIFHLLSSTDPNKFDQIEKILMSMIPITDVCRTDFESVVAVLDKLHDIYIKQNHTEDSTTIEILNNIHNLRMKLQQTLISDL